MFAYYKKQVASSLSVSKSLILDLRCSSVTHHLHAPSHDINTIISDNINTTLIYK